jgi:restriction endonuclease Mrr
LLERVKTAKSEFLEDLIVQLLVAMGTEDRRRTLGKRSVRPATAASTA